MLRTSATDAKLGGSLNNSLAAVGSVILISSDALSRLVLAWLQWFLIEAVEDHPNDWPIKSFTLHRENLERLLDANQECRETVKKARGIGLCEKSYRRYRDELTTHFAALRN